MHASRLDKAYRQSSLERMADQTFDVVIIGGGVTGAGAALDAATRGLNVALIEQRDWASGTSSRSSKLIHGGVRYLEQGDIGLVREALHEQTLMIDRLCPHLVRPIPFLYPLSGRGWERPYVGAGFALYDLLGGGRAVPRHRHYTRNGALRLFPGLRADRLVGGVRYYDAQIDDARHTMTLVRTAALYGAAVASSARVVGFAETGSRVTGVQVRCLESGESFEVRGQQVINATGVWTDEVQSLAGRGRIRVRASKGIHLVVPRDRIHGDCGLILRTSKSVLFVIPWKMHWIIGTTDTDWNLDLAHPAASERDIEYLLGTLNEVLDQPLGHDDIEGVYAGLRPLLHGESDATSKLSREHAVSQSVSGLITVAGGKYTTYRVMAKDAIDMAAHGIAKRVPECCTHRIPLVGAEGYRAFVNRRENIAKETGLHVMQIDQLLSRYGSCTSDLVELMRDDVSLAEPLPGANDYLCAEAHYAASHEGALHLDDVLTRRTRISIETFDRGIEASERVAEIMGNVLGWDEATRKGELHHYSARVRAERESQTQPDDRTADAARLGAPDVRLGGMAQGGSVVHMPERGQGDSS